jgi:hypothetical protein
VSKLPFHCKYIAKPTVATKIGRDAAWAAALARTALVAGQFAAHDIVGVSETGKPADFVIRPQRTTKDGAM